MRNEEEARETALNKIAVQKIKDKTIIVLVELNNIKNRKEQKAKEKNFFFEKAEV